MLRRPGNASKALCPYLSAHKAAVRYVVLTRTPPFVPPVYGSKDQPMPNLSEATHGALHNVFDLAGRAVDASSQAADKGCITSDELAPLLERLHCLWRSKCPGDCEGAPKAIVDEVTNASGTERFAGLMLVALSAAFHGVTIHESLAIHLRHFCAYGDSNPFILKQAKQRGNYNYADFTSRKDMNIKEFVDVNKNVTLFTAQADEIRIYALHGSYIELSLRFVAPPSFIPALQPNALLTIVTGASGSGKTVSAVSAGCGAVLPPFDSGVLSGETRCGREDQGNERT